MCAYDDKLYFFGEVLFTDSTRVDDDGKRVDGWIMGRKEGSESSASGLNQEKVFFLPSSPSLHLETPIPVDESHQLWRTDDKSKKRSVYNHLTIDKGD
jgi:hypothetical protein